jgi:hypothetical protein
VLLEIDEAVIDLAFSLNKIDLCQLRPVINKGNKISTTIVAFYRHKTDNVRID